MAEQKGKPSQSGKTDDTGIPQNITPKDNDATRATDQQFDTEKYVTDDGKLSEDIRLKNPNRNTDKEDATNAGGYKN